MAESSKNINENGQKMAEEVDEEDTNNESENGAAGDHDEGDVFGSNL